MVKRKTRRKKIGGMGADKKFTQKMRAPPHNVMSGGGFFSKKKPEPAPSPPPSSPPPPKRTKEQIEAAAAAAAEGATSAMGEVDALQEALFGVSSSNLGAVPITPGIEPLPPGASREDIRRHRAAVRKAAVANVRGAAAFAGATLPGELTEEELKTPAEIGRQLAAEEYRTRVEEAHRQSELAAKEREEQVAQALHEIDKCETAALEAEEAERALTKVAREEVARLVNEAKEERAEEDAEE